MSDDRPPPFLVDWAAMKQLPSIAEALGCEWGRRIHDKVDTAPCEGMAVERIALHNGTDDFVLMQFCEVHAAKVKANTTSREPPPS